MSKYINSLFLKNFNVKNNITSTPWSNTGIQSNFSNSVYTDISSPNSSTVNNVMFNSFYGSNLDSNISNTTVNNSSTLYIEGSPISGENVTINKPYSLFVNSGDSFFGGNISIYNSNNNSQINLLAPFTGSHSLIFPNYSGDSYSVFSNTGNSQIYYNNSYTNIFNNNSNTVTTSYNMGGYGSSIVSNINKNMTGESYDLTNINVNAKGFLSSSFDGRYIYLGNTSNILIRYDTIKKLNDIKSYSSFLLNNINANFSSCVSSAFDGRYLYIIDSSIYLIRYDTFSEFNNNNSYISYNLTNVDPTLTSFKDIVFDGTYLYFTPNSSKCLRYDTRNTFNNSNSYNVVDFTTFSNFSLTNVSILPQNYVFYTNFKNGNDIGLTNYDNNNLTNDSPNGLVKSYNTSNQTTSTALTYSFSTINTNTVTFVASIYRTATTTYQGILFTRSPSVSGLQVSFALGQNNVNILSYTWNNDANTYAYNTGIVIELNKWYHLALVITSSTASWYVNGILANSRNYAHTSVNFSNINIGIDTLDNARVFPGYITNTAFYNRSLSDVEIYSLYIYTVLTNPDINYSNSISYYGALYDGRYINYIPTYGNSNVSIGTLIRYDTTLSFTSQNSYSSFDFTILNINAKNYYGGTFDGRYMYYVPRGNTSVNYHGLIIRYDTSVLFSNSFNPSSYELFDTTTINLNYKGFWGAIFDGKYVYFIPQTGVLLRYNTTLPFSDINSYSSLDLTNININSYNYIGGIYDGKYIYLTPNENSSSQMQGQFIRIPAYQGLSTNSVSNYNNINVNGLLTTNLMTENTNNINIGTGAGFINQGFNTISIGSISSFFSQNSNSIAIGYLSASSGQGISSIAIGNSAGLTFQKDYSISIGNAAAQTNQGFFNIAIGHQAASSNQSTGAISIGNNTSSSTQAMNSISLGDTSLSYAQNSISIGRNSNNTTTSSAGIAIGSTSTSSLNSVSFGTNTNSLQNAIALGVSRNVNSNAVAIGWKDSRFAHEQNTVSIGYNAGHTGQNFNAIAIGYQAGFSGQSSGSIAIGYQAGYSNQNVNSIAIGYQSGYNNQNSNNVAIGYQAGFINQNSGSIAIGDYAGYQNQNNNSISIGNYVGFSNQNSGSIAIGNFVGYSNQNSNSISIGNYNQSLNQNTGSINIGYKNIIPNISNQIFYTSFYNGNDINITNFNNNLLSTNNPKGYGYSYNTSAGTTSSTVITADVTPFSSANVTLCVSVYITGNSNQRGILLERTNPGAYRGIFINDTLEFYWNGNFGRLIKDDRLTTNTWAHLTYTVSPTETIYYRDGIRFTSGGGGTVQTNLTKFYIGNDIANLSARAFPGLITNVAVYNKTLNAQEVYSVYLSTITPDKSNINTISIGSNSSLISQNQNSISIGNYCGIDQNINNIAIGNMAGGYQSYNAIAIGQYAGGTGFYGSYSMTGLNFMPQGTGSIAIGNKAGYLNQASNSIILNADINQLNSYSSGFYVNPIRQAPTTNSFKPLVYDVTNKEILYLSNNLLINYTGSTGPFNNDTIYLTGNNINKDLSTLGFTGSLLDVSGTVTNTSSQNVNFCNFNSFNIPLISSNNNTLITNSSTVYIEGSPTGSSTLSITNPYSLYINTGSSFFGDDTTINSINNLNNLNYKVQTITMNTVLGKDNIVVNVDTTANNIDVTLPSSTVEEGRIYYLLKTSGNNSMFIKVQTGDYLNGTINNTITITAVNTKRKIVSFGSYGWYIMN